MSGRPRQGVVYVPVPMFVPFSPEKLEKLATRMWPQEYKESLVHLRAARIEFLKAIDSAIGKRISVLEKSSEEPKVQRERVRVT